MARVGGGALSISSSLPPSTFRQLTLNSITLPSSVEQINHGAFHGCSSLESITIPSSVTNIGEYVFMSCKKLKVVTFQPPHQLQTIGQGVFSYCYALERIKIPPTVLEIGASSFKECKNLKEVDLCGGSPNIHVNVHLTFAQNWSTVLSFPLANCQFLHSGNLHGMISRGALVP